jgi:hypothetical protein
MGKINKKKGEDGKYSSFVLFFWGHFPLRTISNLQPYLIKGAMSQFIAVHTILA